MLHEQARVDRNQDAWAEVSYEGRGAADTIAVVESRRFRKGAGA